MRAAAKRRNAQGGTSARRTGAALSFVSFIPLFDGTPPTSGARSLQRVSHDQHATSAQNASEYKEDAQVARKRWTSTADGANAKR